MEEGMESPNLCVPADRPESTSEQLQTALIVCQALSSLGSGLVNISEQIGAHGGEVTHEIRALDERVGKLQGAFEGHTGGCKKCAERLAALVAAEAARSATWKSWLIRIATVIAVVGFLVAALDFVGIDLKEIVWFLKTHMDASTTTP